MDRAGDIAERSVDEEADQLDGLINLDIDEEEGYWSVVISRPDHSNALTSAMLKQFEEILDRAQEETPHVMVISGAGRSFCAGPDLDEARAGLMDDPVWDRVIDKLANLPTLTIAALHGTVSGAALGIPLACDVRIAATGLRMIYPALLLDYMPRQSEATRLAKLVGPARAKMMLISGWNVTAHEAQAWGLVERIIPAETMMNGVRTMVDDVLSAEVDRIRLIKEMIPDAAT